MRRLAPWLVSLALCGGCGGTEPSDRIPIEPDPCKRGQCGIECTSGLDCGNGTYCADDSTCQRDCFAGSGTCIEHQICTQFGQCAYTEEVPGDGVCAARVMEANLTIPTVTLLVDQSGSMTDGYPGGTRWSVLRDALVDPTGGVVARLENSVRFGLALYTSFNGGPTCPNLTEVPPALNNYGAIESVYGDAEPESDTPTGESITRALHTLLRTGGTGPKYIVLATDGEPDTCAVPNPQEGQPEAIAAAQDAHARGVDLFILSVGEGDVSLEHLQDMANAGVGLPLDGTNDAPFYEANDQADLAAAFDAIIGRVLSCTMTVNGTIDPRTAPWAEVRLDGDLLSVDTPDGWQLLDPYTIQLNGAACDQAQGTGSHTMSIRVGCWEDSA